MADNGNGTGIGRAADEMLAPYMERLASMLVGHVTDSKRFRKALHRMDPLVVHGLHHLAPGALGAIVGLAFPRTLFGSGQAAQVAKNAIMHAIRQAADAVVQNGKEFVESEDFADDVEDALNEAEVIVDAFGRFHDPDCVDLQRAVGQPPRQGKKGKRQQAHGTRVKLLKALENSRLRPADCCFDTLQKQLEKPATAAKPKKSGRPRSPMEVIGWLEESDRKVLLDWFLSLPQADQDRVGKALLELDSVDEALPLVDAIREGLDPRPILFLLENTAVRSWLQQSGPQALETVKGLAGDLGDLIVDGAKTVGSAIGGAAKTAGGGIATAATFTWDKAVEANDRLGQDLQPAVTAAQAWAQQQQQQAQQPPPPSVGFWRQLFRDLFSW